MPKSQNQKMKLLYLMRIFSEQTDEQHALTMAQIIERLADMSVSAERKSVYDDIELLRHFGMDIEMVKGSTTGYYLASRIFQTPELKLLVDSVQSSKFITQKKSMELIKKIEGLASIYEGQLLGRQVYVVNRIKTMNESIYYNVDRVHTGIAESRKITFKYFEYTISKDRRYKRQGGLYSVSPFALTWDDENYYMIAYDSDADKIKHYRVDKMADIEITEQMREGTEQYARLDMGMYSKKTFSMFTGSEQSMSLEFDNSLVGAVIDRFGKDVMIMPGSDEGHFRVHLDLAVSPPFFGWLFEFGDKAKIIEPVAVALQMRQMLDSVQECYR